MRGFLRLLLAAGMIAGITSTAIAAPASQRGRAASSGTHVYLLRGLANVFSLGLDDLAQKLGQRGVRTTVANYADAPSIAAEIVARQRAGWRGPVVLIGHSLGADAVYPLAAQLEQAKVRVALVVSFDPIGYQTAPRNVNRVVNYYLSGCCKPVEAGPGFRGSLTNLDLEGKGDFRHLNIEKSPQLHAEVISRVMALSGRGRARPAAATRTAPAAAPDTTGSATSAVSSPALAVQ